MDEELTGWLLVVSNASQKKAHYFEHPLSEKIIELLKDESLQAEKEI